jgi:hypothetical protein
VADHDAGAGRKADIELEAVASGFEGSVKCRNRIFGNGLNTAHSAVTEKEGAGRHELF